MNFCEYISGGFHWKVCDEIASCKIRQKWYCEKHADLIEQVVRVKTIITNSTTLKIDLSAFYKESQ